MTTETLAPETTEELPISEAGPVSEPTSQISRPELTKAMASLSLVNSLLLTGLKSGQQTTGDKAFYAHFLTRMSVHWCNPKECPTMAVNITDKINLYVNPIFFNSMETLAQMEALEHEIEHIVYLHPIRAKDYISSEKNAQGRFRCANIAMDAYINENKTNLLAHSESFIAYNRLNKQLDEMGSNFRVSKNDPWEVNYEKLMAAAKDNDKGDGEGDGFGDPMDDHSKWAEGNGQVSKEIAEGIVRDAANKAQQATGIGNMPDHMMRQISDLNKATVNWKRELRKFFVNSLRFDFERTRNRRNRRYGVIQPGRRKKPNLHVVVCLDSSGSVHDAAFAQFFAELGSISDMGVKITCIDCDTSVAKIYEFDKKKKPERFGNGGTSYAPGIKAAKELEPDGIIYFGDMDCADHPENPGVPFLWAIVGNSNPPASFGASVRVEVEGERY